MTTTIIHAYLAQLMVLELGTMGYEMLQVLWGMGYYRCMAFKAALTWWTVGFRAESMASACARWSTDVEYSTGTI
jgi:hypothetical protein